ncbi:MAG TPA: PSD1 and planctomycete cytochrome C domain-containing protein [Vicinamibacteria bacterium]|nr:PSD1 and planctomycete cytochrome C domain-containing protein [Vicinamibacteria bacterium]
MAAAKASSPEWFEEKIRPLLAARCYECHTDEKSGGLRLDSREDMIVGGESGSAIEPGKPDESLLIQVVRRLPRVPAMPKKAAKLKDEEIEALVEWVRAGAPWPAPRAGETKAAATPARSMITPEKRAFWAFLALGKPPVPAVQDSSWPKTEIDRFILARLEREGLRPVAPADKLTLIRRVTLDLTGVPPTPEEVDAFERDSSPAAFSKVVDRLLASPRYGETWGRMWLDVARYGEDDYRSLDPQRRGMNPYPNAYLYRDWVIKAFNDDLPYDRFVTAQLAADHFEPAERVRHLPALGFLGLGPWYYDNGAVEITRADERNDRVDAVSRGLLGLTVACARCHDHKYDPIPTKDYYSMAGVFLNTEYHEYPMAPKSVVERHKADEKTIEKKEALLGEYLQNESRQLGETLVFQASKYMQAAFRVTGEKKEDKFKVVESEKLDFELFDRWLRFLAKPPVYYPYLKPWQEMIAKGGTKEAAKKLADEFQKQLVDVVLARKEVRAQNEIIAAKALPGNKPKEPANLPNEFVTNDDFCPGCGLELKSLPTEQMNLYNDVFQEDLDATAAPGVPSKAPLLAFRGWGLERQLGPDRRALIEALRGDIEAMRKALPEKFAYVHGVRDLPGRPPENLKVNLRGSVYKLGDEAPRGFLSVLSPNSDAPVTFTTGSGRLELARTILAQPLAMRVIVNRIWKGHFGTGIVDTPSNFGINGERPSHPELLDYLARYFMDHRMSVKALHREILRSAAYRLSGAHSKANAEKDAGNRLYWRANRPRMSAEQIRDSVLFVSGSLKTTMGGPSVTLTPSTTRRTVYGRVSRYKLDEYLQLFDFPSASQTAEKRFSTNVPLQRLFFMNSDFMQQQAERLADRVGGEPTEDARIQKAYRLIFGRAATAPEVEAGREFLRTEPMKQYEERKAEAEKAKLKAKAAAADPKGAAAPEPPAPAAPEAGPEMGMMAGVVPGKGAEAADAQPRLPITIFGRYLKVLLSSNEFLFVS